MILEVVRPKTLGDPTLSAKDSCLDSHSQLMFMPRSNAFKSKWVISVYIVTSNGVRALRGRGW